jgi:hypothetical protein
VPIGEGIGDSALVRADPADGDPDPAVGEIGEIALDRRVEVELPRSAVPNPSDQRI